MKNRVKSKTKDLTLAILGGGFKGAELLKRLDLQPEFKKIIALDYKAPPRQYKNIKFILTKFDNPIFFHYLSLFLHNKQVKNMKRIVIFASGSGTNAENIIQYFSATKIASVVAVFTNKTCNHRNKSCSRTVHLIL